MCSSVILFGHVRIPFLGITLVLIGVLVSIIHSIEPNATLFKRAKSHQQFLWNFTTHFCASSSSRMNESPRQALNVSGEEP